MKRRSFVLGAFGFPWFFHRHYTRFCGVRFHVIRHDHGPHRYLRIHGDETTADEVLAAWMKDHRGTAYSVTNQQRNVEVLGLRIDPNRFFSRVGAEKSLRNLNHEATDQQIARVLDFLDRDRPALLERLIPPAEGRMFALHNNRDYSVQDELAASDQTSIRQPDLPRNFFLCTRVEDYNILKESPYNVVLQVQAEPDDGSLSRLFARRGLRYINLECAIGEFDAQMARVKWLEAHLK